MTVVYVDILFLINFCMDFLALWIAGALLHLPAKRVRLIVAAALGGGYAVLEALFHGNAAVSLLLSLAVAFLLCYVAHKEVGRRAYWRLVTIFFGISWLLGGMIGTFYNLLSRFLAEREALLNFLLEGDGKLAFFVLVALSSVMLIGVWGRHMKFGHHTAAVSILIREGTRECTVSAFVDSGNTLCDPLSGRPCILVKESAVFAVVPPDIRAFAAHGELDPFLLSEKSRRRVRLIPSESLGGHTLLVAYLPESLQLVSASGARPLDAVVALVSEKKGDFCGHDGLISPILVA